MKIAIIGTGISGLGAAYLLHPHHDITVYESHQQVGGHSRTIDITVDNRTLAVDTGFIVFNERNYPHLCGLFKHLHVPTQKSDMSFGASIRNGWLEYSSKGLFAQMTNLIRPRFWGMIRDILTFNRHASAYMDADPHYTLGALLSDMRLGDWFSRYYLQAMGAAIWSCSVETILKYPARTFLHFFRNHGLLTINDHPQWHTVTGGSREYIKRLTASFSDRIRLNCGAVQVMRTTDGVAVTDTRGDTHHYDHVILACHADRALGLIEQTATQPEKDILGAFDYQDNDIVVHSDPSFMPRRRGCWASWIYLAEEIQDQKPFVSLSYWMNNLQNLATDVPVLVTLNPGRMPDPNLTYDRHRFRHPVFDTKAIQAQQRISAIQGQNRLWFCGAYQSYGFHEDGLASSVRIAQAFGITPPWL